MENADPNSESLAIVELNEKITSSPAVQPACVNWDKNETVAAKEGTLGLVRRNFRSFVCFFGV
jgi:hypothetical protein